MTEEVNTTEETGTEFVETHEATDAELDAFLKEQPFDKETTEAAPAKEEDQPVVEKEDEQLSEESKSAEKLAALEKANAELQSKLEKQRRVLEQSELFNKRRSTELGEERKKTRELQSKLSEYLTDENFQLNPSQANRALLEHDKLEQKAKGLEAEEIRLQRISDGQAILSKNIDVENIPLDAIAEVLVGHDGLPENFVRSFLPGMLEFNGVEPETVLQIVKRAELWTETKKALTFASEKIKTLEEENAKLKGKSDTVLKDVQKALKRGPQMTAASGGGAEGRSGSSGAVPALMSDAELEEFLAASK